MSKSPTPQGISALLRKAGFQRSQSRPTRIRGWRESTEGYRVTPGYEGEVEVYHLTGFSRNVERQAAKLAEYAEAIRARGWEVDASIPHKLIVTAREADQ